MPAGDDDREAGVPGTGRARPAFLEGQDDLSGALSHIHSFGRFSAKPTLDRMETLMGLLGDPQERLRIVHVAGTNGKGSTCAMIASMLEAAGYRTGALHLALCARFPGAHPD